MWGCGNGCHIETSMQRRRLKSCSGSVRWESSATQAWSCSWVVDWNSFVTNLTTAITLWVCIVMMHCAGWGTFCKWICQCHQAQPSICRCHQAHPSICRCHQASIREPSPPSFAPRLADGWGSLRDIYGRTYYWKLSNPLGTRTWLPPDWGSAKCGNTGATYYWPLSDPSQTTWRHPNASAPWSDSEESA